MFRLNTLERGGEELYCTEHDHYIPLDPANRHYQKVLDAIIEQGASCFDGDIPVDLQTAADEKQFNQQLVVYTRAVRRLAEYELSVGRAEVTEEVITGQEWDDEADALVDVTTTVVMSAAIDPLPATVTVFGDNGEEVEVPNPRITKDNEERAAAQAVVDATPQAVIDAYNEG